MTYLQTTNGIKIYKDEKDKKNPYVTIIENIPILGTIQTGHKTLARAELYTLTIKKQTK